MDFFRRLHQSYPPRPSPLSNSQESRDDRPRSHASATSTAAAAAAAVATGSPSTVAANESRNRPDDKIRIGSRYEYPPPSSSHPHPYSSGARGSHRLRRDTAGAHNSPPRNHAHQHRRHASLETRQQGHVHRRNHSQPQTGLQREVAMNHQPPDPTRSASHGSGGSPAHSVQEQSAPPAFGIRQMPPPSPPHAYSSRSQSANAPAFSRETPGGHLHRPGSSMSISSMLGSDPERPARDAASLYSRPSPVFGNAPASSSSITAAAMSPPSAPARQPPLDQSLFRRSHTPEKSFSKPPLGRPYRSGSGGGSSLLGDSSKYGGLSRLPHSQYPEKPHSTHPSPKVSPADSPYNEPRRMSFSGPIARSNSQPPNADTATRPPGYSPISRPSGGVADRLSYGGVDPAARDHGREQNRFGGLYGDRRSEETAPRDRDRLGLGQDTKGSLGGSARYGSMYGEREPLDRHSSASNWEQGRSHPSSPEAKRLPAFESGSGFGFGAIQSYTKSLGSQPGGGRQPALSLQTGQSQTTPSPHESPYLSKQPPPSQAQRLGSTPATASSAGLNSLGLTSASDDGRRKGSDELLAHRNLLAIGADGKRGGRASPLPQAVQGAQAPFIGATGEPSIKNELGRVFSGIGSGVGGVTAGVSGVSGSGPSTPLISSPFKRDNFAGRQANGETDEAKIARPPSASGTRRSRKSRDEDVQMDLEGGTGLSGRGSRRARHPHHHHHHHHHHRSKPEEEAFSTLTGLHRPPSSTNYFNRTSTPSEGPGHHHHHHHHHPHHHHHHSHPPQPAVAPPLREPRTTVNLEPLLSSVAHLPRHHLGSTLYTPRISIPNAKASAESSKFGYTTTPQPLPRFEQRENCTFTVRVPRFRIDTSHREEICARRALWGTGVYTDDSDPVAAAIHSGFIRGAWGEDVDESMLDLEIKDTYQHAPPKEDTDDKTNGVSKEDDTPTDGPRLPPIPPPNQDLHITLLVLPRLENYDATIMFGIKSRKWQGRHDGMSFKVQRVDWVDEGVARGEERSGEARRKRLRTLMQTGRICTGPAMAKMDELRRSGVQVPRTLGQGQDQPAPVQPVS